MRYHTECNEYIDLTKAKSITSNNFPKSLTELKVLCTREHSLCILDHNLYCSIHSFCLFVCLLDICLVSYIFCFSYMAKNVFHLVPCNFRQSYCGFLKKTLSFFLMVFDGNSTLFIPVISEKSKFANLSYVYKNDKNLTKLATFLSITLLDTTFSCSFIYKINCYPVI